MNPELKAHLEETATKSIGYIRRLQDAADIKNCGVDELIVLLAKEDKARVRDAAAICKEPPAIQRAACGLLKGFSHLISLSDVVCEIKRALESDDNMRQLFDPNPVPTYLQYDANSLALSVRDLELVRIIREKGVPEIIIVLANLSKNVTLTDAATICDETPNVQRAACELWLIRTWKSQNTDLESCVQEIKKFVAQD